MIINQEYMNYQIIIEEPDYEIFYNNAIEILNYPKNKEKHLVN